VAARAPRIIVTMLLALDIGNTNVTVGLFRAGALLATRRAATNALATTDEVELLLDGLLRLDGIALADLDAIALASVVPTLSGAVEAIAERRACPLLVAGPGTVPLAVRVDRPGDVGADRLVNALAAARLHGTPAVVVDFGTATTFDCVARGRGLCRRGDRAGSRARAGSARRADRQAATDRAARPGPGDRSGHRERDAVRDDLRLPGARDRPPRPDPAGIG